MTDRQDPNDALRDACRIFLGNVDRAIDYHQSKVKEIEYRKQMEPNEIFQATYTVYIVHHRDSILQLERLSKDIRTSYNATLK